MSCQRRVRTKKIQRHFRQPLRFFWDYQGINFADYLKKSETIKGTYNASLMNNRFGQKASTIAPQISLFTLR